MAYVAVNKNGQEIMSKIKPNRVREEWNTGFMVCGWDFNDIPIFLPKGTIKKIIGKDLSWWDSPVELKEEEVK